MSLRVGYGHLAAAAVEMEGEALAVVQKKERAAVLGALVDRAETKFVTDAVFRADEFNPVPMGDFVCLFNGSGFR